MMKTRRSTKQLIAVMLALTAGLVISVVLPSYSVGKAAQQFMKQGEAQTASHTPEPSGKIAFASDLDGDYEIYVMNPDGGGQTRLTDNSGEDIDPSWSPDGTRLAFVSARDGNTEIYVMNADGSNQTRLTTDPADDLAPVWSPDGVRIAFASGRNGNDEIYVMNADGSGQTNLSNDPADDTAPTWSPDNARLAFASARDGNFEIYVMNADGGNQTRLTNNPADDLNPAWSPMKITFQSNRDGNDELYVINPDGSSQERLTNDPALDIDPARSSDGARVVFASTRDGNLEIYALDSSGSLLTKLTSNEASDFQPAVQPLDANQPQSTLQFATATFSIVEGAASVAVTVTRSGGAAGAAAVDYAATSGTASDRSDFTLALGTLRFATGETQKAISILIIDDALLESDETVNLTLGNPTGATLGALNSATLTIADNDTTPSAANPIDDSRFFVRQQYLDFLSREPEQAGVDAWLAVLNRCGGDAQCLDTQRIEVSSSFFRSEEFQNKGYFVYRFYRASFGRQPTYMEFIRDLQRVNGQTGEEVVANLSAFTNEWTERADFEARYDGLANEAYVDALLQTAGVTMANRTRLVSDLNTGQRTRAQVLRAVVESTELFQKEFNRGFVTAAYFGYLRREPEPEGFNAWLAVLDRNPQDFRTLVRGFVNSVEYRLRFGRQ